LINNKKTKKILKTIKTKKDEKILKNENGKSLNL
jgi:hypothetical protein